MPRPSVLTPAYGNYKVTSFTLTTGVVTPVAIPDPSRACLIFAWTPSGSGTPGSTIYGYIAPDGSNPTTHGLLIWQTTPVYVLHSRDWGPFVNIGWSMQTPVTGNKLLVFEYQWIPENIGAQNDVQMGLVESTGDSQRIDNNNFDWRKFGEAIAP